MKIKFLTLRPQKDVERHKLLPGQPRGHRRPHGDVQLCVLLHIHAGQVNRQSHLRCTHVDIQGSGTSDPSTAPSTSSCPWSQSRPLS